VAAEGGQGGVPGRGRLGEGGDVAGRGEAGGGGGDAGGGDADSEVGGEVKKMTPRHRSQAVPGRSREEGRAAAPDSGRGGEAPGPVRSRAWRRSRWSGPGSVGSR